MSEKYYTIDEDAYESYWADGNYHGGLKEADIGWRWCSEELPLQVDTYEIRDSNGARNFCEYHPDTLKWFNKHRVDVTDFVEQWLKAPEPLEEEQ